VWEMDFDGFGSFVSLIPARLGIGTVTLEDGSSVKCFLCERRRHYRLRRMAQVAGAAEGVTRSPSVISTFMRSMAPP
jgi:allophanate hydrolase